MQQCDFCKWWYPDEMCLPAFSFAQDADVALCRACLYENQDDFYDDEC